MSALKQLAACAGQWHGQSKLQDPHSGTTNESASLLKIVSILAGHFVHIEYDWKYKSVGQSGFFIVGHEVQSGTITIYWGDTWHMGDAAMLCRGSDTDGILSVRGSYSAGDGSPDWGWRIVLAPDSEEHLRMTMFNIDPGGHEDLAVEAVYTRA